MQRTSHTHTLTSRIVCVCVFSVQSKQRIKGLWPSMHSAHALFLLTHLPVCISCIFFFFFLQPAVLACARYLKDPCFSVWVSSLIWGASCGSLGTRECLMLSSFNALPQHSPCLFSAPLLPRTHCVLGSFFPPLSYHLFMLPVDFFSLSLFLCLKGTLLTTHICHLLFSVGCSILVQVQ